MNANRNGLPESVFIGFFFWWCEGIQFDPSARMSLEISAGIVGKKVAIPGRADWGIGTVRRVQSSTVNGVLTHRISVQFQHGTRMLIAPPARLIEPTDDPKRADAGWLDSIGGRSIDQRLKELPESVTQVLGTIRQRLDAVLPYYALRDEPKVLVRWARGQTGVGDPLSEWSRDELQIAFQAFRNERDAHLRGLGALLKKTEGDDAVRNWLAGIDAEIREEVRAALQRAI